MQKSYRVAALAAIMVLAAFFRFWHITDAPPGLYPDEAMNGTNAQEAIQTGDYKIFYPDNNGREGFFMNIQSLSVRVFGNEPWALRVVSAFFGTLTVLGIYLLTRELFRKSDIIPLLAAFFTATSFWHINFSRIGFRAIMVPFLLAWAFYFFFRMVRQMSEGDIKKASAEISAISAGIFYGLGFHTYLAFRVTPLLLAPAFFYGWSAYKSRSDGRGPDPKASGLLAKRSKPAKCYPCLFVLFLFATFVTVLPIGYYFLQNPADFAGRTAQVSVFASESPLQNLALNKLKTIGMFFVMGDWNWRHNLAGAPLLWWPVSILFALGIIFGAKNIIQSIKIKGLNSISKIFNFGLSAFYAFFANPYGFLLSWLVILSIPSIISNEGLPHALRAIGMIPPVMILSAVGTAWVIEYARLRLPILIKKFPERASQIRRIQKELMLLLVIFCGFVTVVTYINYFLRWAQNPETRGAFTSDYVNVGRYLRSLPEHVLKYVIVNEGGVLVRGLPMPAQSTMYMLGEGVRSRGEITPNNVSYILPEDLAAISIESVNEHPVYMAMLKDDPWLRTQLKTLFPSIVFEPIPGSLLIGIIK